MVQDALDALYDRQDKDEAGKKRHIATGELLPDDAPDDDEFIADLDAEVEEFAKVQQEAKRKAIDDELDSGLGSSLAVITDISPPPSRGGSPAPGSRGASPVPAGRG